MSAYADTDDVGLFTETEAKAYPELSFTAICHRCGARTEPIPHEDLRTGEPLDPGAPWMQTIVWGLIALGQHEAECPALEAGGR